MCKIKYFKLYIHMVFMNKQKIFLVLALLFAIISIPFIGNRFEGFSNLTPGTYPISEDIPLLHEYPLKKQMGISTNTYAENSKQYPIFGSSYDQNTNNVRYWASPDNGECSPAEFCGGLYDNKKIDIPKTPTIIPFSSSDIRVNYYGSHKIDCPASMDDNSE